jgi:DEAD/DEAH box helicase domain-containing protein
MRKVVFDIETKNIFQDVGKNDPTLLDLSVVCIYDSETNAYTCYEESQLKDLWPILEKTDLLIGYNSDHFDIPLLNKYYPGDLTKIKSLDILKEIKNATGRRFKLDHIAEGTLGINKSGHGLQAITWWKQGEYDKVKKYCIDDVKITKRIYDFAVKHQKLKYRDAGKNVSIPINTADWETIPETSMTFTLPF